MMIRSEGREAAAGSTIGAFQEHFLQKVFSISIEVLLIAQADMEEIAFSRHQNGF